MNPPAPPTNHPYALGAVRRMDDLGRVILPEEIRDLLDIPQGGLVDIYAAQGSIRLRAYPALTHLDKPPYALGTVCRVTPKGRVRLPLELIDLQDLAGGGKLSITFMDNEVHLRPYPPRPQKPADKLTVLDLPCSKEVAEKAFATYLQSVKEE